MKQYEVFELVISGEKPVESDVAVDLAAEFTYENGESVKVKGFYAGADTYKIRFLRTDWKSQLESDGYCAGGRRGGM